MSFLAFSKEISKKNYLILFFIYLCKYVCSFLEQTIVGSNEFMIHCDF